MPGNFPPAYFLPEQQKAVLQAVSRIPGRVVPTDEIVNHVWQQHDEPSGDLKKHIAVLVCKLNKRLGRRVIAGVRGQTGGFYLVTENG